MSRARGSTTDGSEGADPAEVARLLAEIGAGDKEAVDKLSALVYKDMRRYAAGLLRRRFGPNVGNITLVPTALVHETYLRMVRQRKGFDTTGHFFAIASRVMLRVLNDYQRRKQAARRGAGRVQVTLTDLAKAPVAAGVPELTAALERLETLDARGAEVVKLRVLWGLTVPEIAETLGVSPSTIEREWRFARRWLAARLGENA